MACTYHVASSENLDLLVQMRVEFIQDMHPEYSDEKMKERRSGVEAYVATQYASGSYIGFWGENDGTVVCSGALLVYHLPPLNGKEGRKIGHVLNFFTRKEHRKKGYGLGLMSFMKEYARDHGFSRLFLNATEDGYPLYVKAGYTDANRAMEFNIEP